MEFLSRFYTVFIAMLQIFSIVICGFMFYRWEFIDKKAITGLTNLTIKLFLPALIFSHLIKKFSFSDPADWWVYPFWGICVCLIGCLVAKLYLSFDKRISKKNEFISVVSFQNCGYLPLILVMSIFPEKQASVLFTYIFLFIQGYNIIFWSLGIQFLLSKREFEFDLKKVFNPPFLSLAVAFLLLLFDLKRFVPTILLDATELIGGCTLPIALISLGAILASGCFSKPESYDRALLTKCLVLKLIVMPIILLATVIFFRFPAYMSILLLIQASMPAAINLSVVSFQKNPKCSFVTQAVFLTHLFGIVTVPFFLAVLSVFVNY